MQVHDLIFIRSVERLKCHDKPYTLLIYTTILVSYAVVFRSYKKE